VAGRREGVPTGRTQFQLTPNRFCTSRPDGRISAVAACEAVDAVKEAVADADIDISKRMTPKRMLTLQDLRCMSVVRQARLRRPPEPIRITSSRALRESG
jgi:hypothetical protein